MSKIFINGLSCISPQPTFTEEFPMTLLDHSLENVLCAIEPSYKEYISPAASRRMAKGVKMGTATAMTSLKQAGISLPDAIVVGTGLGCIQDSEKFLKGILDNQEQHLTPTSFIQSTHNTVAGQIALNLQCKGLNFSYVNGAVSFESALLESILLIQTEGLHHILVGAVDEHASHTIYLYELSGSIKSKEALQQSSPTSGIRMGEGATFFVLSDTFGEETLAELVDVTFCNQLENNSIEHFIHTFLSREGLELSDIDLIVSGRNENQDDTPYFENFERLFPNATSLIYKHLTGEFFTASAIGTWLGCQALQGKEIPKAFFLRKNLDKPLQYVLLYNQYLGREHSLVLLRKK